MVVPFLSVDDGYAQVRADTAARTGQAAAVVSQFSSRGLLPFALQIGLGGAVAEVVPGQGFVEAARPGGIVIGVDAGQVEGFHPHIVIEHFRPAVELAAQFPGFVEDFAHAAVAAGEGRFQAARLGVMVMVGNVFVVDEPLDVLLFPFDFFNRQLAEPLEGRVRLGYEARYGDRDLAIVLVGHFAVEIEDLVGQVGDAGQVFVHFCRQAHHEIELDRGPAVFKGIFTGCQQIFFRNALVDNVAQALSPGFGRKGQAALADLLDLLGDIDGKAVDPQRWQADADFLALEFVQELVDQFGQAGIIGRAQAHEGNLIVARIGDDLFGQVGQVFRRLFPDRPVEHAGLTETAAAAAAAEEFQDGPVVDDVDVGYDRFRREEDVFHIGNDAFLDFCRRSRFSDSQALEVALCIVLGFIEGRHVVARLLGELLQEALLAARFPLLFPGDDRIGQDLRRFFRFAQEKDVDVIGQGFGVVGTGTAGCHQGHVVAAVFGKERDAGQIEHVEDVGKAHFVLERKADHIEVAYRRLRFQGKERIALAAHDFFHIRPGRVDPFGCHIGPFIEERIEDAQAQMAHGDFVDVRETIGNGQFDGIVVLDDAVPFAADVAGRLADFAQ